MPALPVNEGYYMFHNFCDFVERMVLNSLQCYHEKNWSKKINQILFGVGEDVIYQNLDHVEKGIIERITYENKLQIPHFHIKFKDNRVVKIHANNLHYQTLENDFATLPITLTDFLA